MATEKERQEFIARFCAEYTGKRVPDFAAEKATLGGAHDTHTLQQCIDAARALLRHAHTHGNLAVQQCNGPQHLNGPSPYNWHKEPVKHTEWINGNHAAMEAWEARLERDQERVEKRIKEICAGFNLPVTLGGDPRGFTVKLKLSSGAYNTWGGSEDGYGVPQ